ncbi:TetR/AcrR family transcriptional regulator [Roseibium sp. M-1]
MPRPASNRKAEITEAAAGTIYEKGYTRTTLADVAEAAGIPVGSVYYYFKTREDVARGVIASLADRYAEMRSSWEALPDPRERILAFVVMTAGNSESLSRFGCPVGSLGTELGKQDQALRAELAAIFAGLLDWLTGEFRALGCSEGVSRQHAVHVLTVLQGASLLTHLFEDPAVIEGQVDDLTRYIRAVGNPEQA